MTEDALALVVKRNQFFRRLHYQVIGLFMMGLIVVGLLMWVLWKLMQSPTEPYYFATDKLGRLIRVVPLTEPNMSQAGVVAWVKEAVQSALSYDFVNYRAQLQSAQKYFTPYGWYNYMKTINMNNNLVAVTRRKMVVIAEVVDQPRLIREGLLGGEHAWRYQFQVLMTYLEPPFDAAHRFVNPLDVSVIVMRQSILQSDQGLGIAQIIGNLATGTAPTTAITTTPSG